MEGLRVEEKSTCFSWKEISMRARYECLHRVVEGILVAQSIGLPSGE